jgi:HK97 family phage major capsid protein
MSFDKYAADIEELRSSVEAPEVSEEVTETPTEEVVEEVAAEATEETTEEVRSEEVEAEDTTAEINDTETAEEVAPEADVEIENRAASTPSFTSSKMDNINNLQERFSLARAIQAVTNGQALTGAEAEVAAEARHQAAAHGVQLAGQIALPSEFRADPMTATNNGGSGAVQTSENIFDDPKAILPSLRPNTVFEKLGATYFRNANGPVVIPRQTGSTTADSTLTEVEAISTSNISMDQITLNPQRIGAGTSYSRQLLMQSLESLDAFILADLNKTMGLAVDDYLIAKLYAGVSATDGTGVAVEEIPFLMEEELRLANANADGAKFAMDPTANRRLRRAVLDAGSGLFAGDYNSTIGYGQTVSTQFNADDIILGDFSDFVVCEWSGMDLIVDPYTGAANDVVKVTANTYLDGTVRRADSFSRYNNVGA